MGALLGGLGGGPGGPPDQGSGGDDPVALLTQMMDLAAQYKSVEPDEEDKLMMEKISTLIQQLKAKDQQDQDGAMGGSNSRLMRKAGAA